VADPGGGWGDAYPHRPAPCLPLDKVETRVKTIGSSLLFQSPDDDADRWRHGRFVNCNRCVRCAPATTSDAGQRWEAAVGRRHHSWAHVVRVLDGSSRQAATLSCAPYQSATLSHYWRPPAVRPRQTNSGTISRAFSGFHGRSLADETPAVKRRRGLDG